MMLAFFDDPSVQSALAIGYGLLCVPALWLQRWWFVRARDRLDTSAHTEQERRQGVGRLASASAYRTAVQRRLLTIGTLPVGEEIFAVAYLRAQAESVAEAVVATAVGRGWIARAEPGNVLVRRLPEGALIEEQELFAAIGEGKVGFRSLMTVAVHCAAQRGKNLRAAIEGAGLVRPDRIVEEARWRGLRRVALPIVLVGAAMFVMVIRQPDACHDLGFALMLEVPLFVGLSLLVTVESWVNGRGNGYLAWLRGVTAETGKAVRSGRERDPEACGLIAGLDGSWAVPLIRETEQYVRAEEHREAVARLEAQRGD